MGRARDLRVLLAPTTSSRDDERSATKPSADPMPSGSSWMHCNPNRPFDKWELANTKGC